VKLAMLRLGIAAGLDILEYPGNST